MVEIDSSALYDLKEFRDLLGLENWCEFWKKETLHLKRGGGWIASLQIDLKVPLNLNTFQKTLKELKKTSSISLG